MVVTPVETMNTRDFTLLSDIERDRLVTSGRIWGRILPTQIQPYFIWMQDPFWWSWSTLFQVT